MATTACTSYYTVDLVGIVPGPLDDPGEIVTFNTPQPVWTVNNDSGTTDIALQCNAVAIGGFNGLNS